MAFAVSAGALRTIERPVAQAPYSLKVSDDFSQDYAEIYRVQPAVRTVVDFLARNIAQLSLHSFRRISDTDRERLTDHPVARILGRPNPRTTQFRYLRSLVSDIGLYDVHFSLKLFEQGLPNLVRLPPAKVAIAGDEDWLEPQAFVVSGSKGSIVLPAERVLYFRGYNPVDARTGLSPIESLRRTLAEEYASGQQREQTLRNGARLSGYLQRPADAPTWSDPARQGFKQAWRQQYSGWSATEAGGTPILEDGMTFVPAAMNAVDLQYVEARKLSVYEVARAYFIPPPMIGLLDEATFGNIEEQHKMLYADTLGPWLQEIQQEFSLQLIPELPDSENVYVEFNLAEKLRGSFEEQAAQLQTSVGAPYMTRNEARARANLPAIDGGDELVTPLNVLIGGQASPTDSAPTPDGALSWRIPGQKSIEVKARPTSGHQKKAAEVIAKFFGRQESSVRSALGAKAADGWWNEDRWNDELAAELYAVSALVSKAVARTQLDQLGVDPNEYDVDRTLAYLSAVSRANAKSINTATKRQLDAALDDPDDPMGQVTHVFDVAKSARADQAGLTIATALAGFASTEAVNQVKGQRTATKTWIVTSSNPRSAHAAMNGETVPIDQTFSNGAKWPGDSLALDVDDIAGCRCDLRIDFE